MSRLRDRIQRLKGTTPSAETARDDLERDHSLPPFSRFMDTEDGRFIVRERIYPLHHEHGIYRLGDLTGSHDRLTRISRKFIHLTPVSSHRNLLFFDTETSGLGIGAGNLPFMLGIGFYSEEAFIVQQLFVRNPGEERAMLIYFAELCSRFTHLVTYNGRSFDWPIVLNRFVLNRIPFDGAAMEQLDLLYISRNLWKHSLESCRLSKVEEERLGIMRNNDVSGALAPMIYFQYLADGDIGPLEGVFEHNELDVLTLSTLASHLGAILSGSVDWQRLAAEDLYRIGVWLVDCGLPTLAEEAFEVLLKRSGEVMAKYYAPLAAIYKKQRNYEKAVKFWKLAAERSVGHVLRSATVQALQPLIELAMYYEHHVKQAQQALHYTEEALNRLERRLSLQRGSDKERALAQELQHRRSRLVSRLYREIQSEELQFDLLL